MNTKIRDFKKYVRVARKGILDTIFEEFGPITKMSLTCCGLYLVTELFGEGIINKSRFLLNAFTISCECERFGHLAFGLTVCQKVHVK